MKKLLAATLLAASFATPAFSADMAVKAPMYTKAVAPAFNWSGFYLGGFIGGAAGDGNATATEPRSTAGAFYNGFSVINSSNLSSSFIGGGTVGYNWQAPGSALVLGLEGEAGYLHLKSSAQDVNAVTSGFGFPDSINTSRIGDWYGVIAGRVGFAVDRALFYGKGGVAFVNKSYSFNDSCVTGTCGASTLILSHTDTQATWAAGAGLEYALTNNWSIKGEYLYLGSRKTYVQTGVAGGGLAGTIETNSNTDPGVHTGKIGLNYKFGGPIVAKY